MRLGLLADIHEEVENLGRAIDALRSAGVSRFVVLGDVFETGLRLEETVAALRRIDHEGVWGNHEFGLCHEISDWTRAHYPPAILDYFAGYRPSLEVAGCLFQHIEPHLDPRSLEDIWGYGGAGLLDPARGFAAVPHRRIFMGHIHRWALVTPAGEVPWGGLAPAKLDPGTRYLVVVHGVQQGYCAWYDTDRDEVVPLKVV